jgi:hypothetical protein
MPLGPRSVACVQPAPKSRFVASGLLRTKIKIKIDANGNGNGYKGADRSHAPRGNAVKEALRPK